MKLGLSVLPSFHPSVLPSGSSLKISSLVFPETQHVRGPCVVVRDRARFLEENFLAQKVGKIGQK